MFSDFNQNELKNEKKIINYFLILTQQACILQRSADYMQYLNKEKDKLTNKLQIAIKLIESNGLLAKLQAHINTELTSNSVASSPASSSASSSSISSSATKPNKITKQLTETNSNSQPTLTQIKSDLTPKKTNDASQTSSVNTPQICRQLSDTTNLTSSISNSSSTNLLIEGERAVFGDDLNSHIEDTNINKKLIKIFDPSQPQSQSENEISISDLAVSSDLNRTTNLLFRLIESLSRVEQQNGSRTLNLSSLSMPRDIDKNNNPSDADDENENDFVDINQEKEKIEARNLIQIQTKSSRSNSIDQLIAAAAVTAQSSQLSPLSPSQVDGALPRKNLNLNTIFEAIKHVEGKSYTEEILIGAETPSLSFQAPQQHHHQQQQQPTDKLSQQQKPPKKRKYTTEDITETFQPSPLIEQQHHQVNLINLAATNQSPMWSIDLNQLNALIKTNTEQHHQILIAGNLIQAQVVQPSQLTFLGTTNQNLNVATNEASHQNKNSQETNAPENSGKLVGLLVTGS